MDILRRLGAALREALGASRDEDEFSRASIHVNEDPGPRTFWMLISAVVLLAGSVVYLVLVTGGVENSPFLQFLLNYFVCGILMTREIRAKVLLLAISVVLPFAVLAVGAAVEIDGGARDFSASNYAVLTAVCVLIVGIVNLIVGPKVTYEGDSASPEGDDLRAA